MAVSFLVAYSTYNPNQRTLFEASKKQTKNYSSKKFETAYAFYFVIFKFAHSKLKEESTHNQYAHHFNFSSRVSSTVIQPCMDHRGEGF